MKYIISSFFLPKEPRNNDRPTAITSRTHVFISFFYLIEPSICKEAFHFRDRAREAQTSCFTQRLSHRDMSKGYRSQLQEAHVSHIRDIKYEKTN